MLLFQTFLPYDKDRPHGQLVRIPGNQFEGGGVWDAPFYEGRVWKTSGPRYMLYGAQRMYDCTIFVLHLYIKPYNLPCYNFTRFRIPRNAMMSAYQHQTHTQTQP